MMTIRSSTSDFAEDLSMSTPAVYQIEIKGKVDITWHNLLAGMNITNMEIGSTVVTTLVGKLNDQAALAGILQTIYEMKLPILSVQFKG
ncbi:MAG: hypothetical protein ACHQIH_04195 [Ignavibacteria bacterium]